MTDDYIFNFIIEMCVNIERYNDIYGYRPTHVTIDQSHMNAIITNGFHEYLTTILSYKGISLLADPTYTGDFQILKYNP